MKQTENTDLARELIRNGHFNSEQLAKRSRYVKKFREFYTMSVEVWDDIEVIKEEKLYWPHATVKEFCKEECGWSDDRFYQIASAVKVRSALPAPYRPLVGNERQARELSKVPESKRAEVLTEAKRNTLGTEKVTAKSIKEAANNAKNVDIDGTEVPEGDASYHWSRRNQGEEALSKIRSAQAAISALNPDDVMWLECCLQDVSKYLRIAHHTFKGGLPAYVCVKCKGKSPRNCTFCHGRGMNGTWKVKQNAGGKEYLEELSIRS